MYHVLEEVEWGEPALSLLSHCKDLDKDLPAVIHIRHSERPRIKKIGDGRQTLLNTAGKQAAYEYGANLPPERKYRLYHTHYERTKETIQQIHQGIVDNDGKSKIMRALPIATILNPEQYRHYISRDTEGGDTDETAMSCFHNWVSGRYPPWVIYPCGQFAQRVAAIMMNNLRSANSTSVDIYVSHDTWITAFLYNWFSIPPPSDWIQFLDGFILQPTDELMNVYFRELRKEVYYPYWWNFK